MWLEKDRQGGWGEGGKNALWQVGTQAPLSLPGLAVSLGLGALAEVAKNSLPGGRPQSGE